MPFGMFIGIDVQARRGCSYAVLDERGGMVESGWLEAGPAGRLDRDLEVLLASHPGARFGVDAPRRPLEAPRDWFWRGGGWRPRADGERGSGRHCEVVVKALGLANPQWTPLAEDAPAWMTIGFRIFAALAPVAPVVEVFPSASYKQLEGDASARATLDFSAFRPGPKDMLDAVMAAVTVREFAAGKGAEVGGGDGLGTIVLPRPAPFNDSEVFEWPEGAPHGE
jgi:hypothetical protein